MEGKKNLGLHPSSPRPPTLSTSSALPASSKLPKSTTSLAPLTMQEEVRRRPPSKPDIFKQLSEPILNSLNELAQMQIAVDQASAASSTTPYRKDPSPNPIATPQEDSLFQKALGNSLRANHLEIKTKEWKEALAHQGFPLNDKQWRDLLRYQIYLIQNQEMAASAGLVQASKETQQKQEWDEKERAAHQQEIALLQLAIKWIHEAHNLDQKLSDNKYPNSHRLGENFFTTSEWMDHPHRLFALIDLRDQDVLRFIIQYILPQDHWKEHPQLVVNLIQRAGEDQSTLQSIAIHVLSQEHWAKYPESPSWMTTLLQQTGSNPWTLQSIAKHVLSKEYWANHSESPSWVASLFQQAGNDPWTLQYISLYVLSQEHWAKYPESPLWVTTILQRAGDNQWMLRYIAHHVLSQEYWAKHPESPTWATTLIQQAGDNQEILQDITRYVLSQEYWANHPEKSPAWVTTLVRQARDNQWTLRSIAHHVLSKEYWQNHPQLKTFVRWGIIPRPVTVENIRSALARRKYPVSPIDTTYSHIYFTNLIQWRY